MHIQPMSYNEALALVQLLGGAGKPADPAFAHLKGHPLQQIYAMLTDRQRRAFMVTINHVWPKPQRRSGRTRPVDPLGLTTKIENWDQAWAIALSAASVEQREWYEHKKENIRT